MLVAEPNWPPKSPRDALLSSPSGRKKYQEMQRRREVMGSPLKRFESAPNFREKAEQLLSDGVEGQEDEEDEETLQLKLAAIEAKLKLKQLQKSRRPGTSSSNLEDGDHTHSRPTSAISFSPRSQDPALTRNSSSSDSKAQQDEVQVPLSPTRRQAVPAEPWSPRRCLLGIDKGRKGTDVSLKRPPSSKAGARPASRLGNREGAMSRTGDIFSSPNYLGATGEGGKPSKSFSERIAESRTADRSRRERAERAELIQSKRNSAFQFDKAEVEAYKAAAADARARSPPKSPIRHRQPENFSRDDILQSYNRPNVPPLKRSQTAPSSRNYENRVESKGPHFHTRHHKSESESFTSRPRSSQEPQDDGDGEGKAPDPSKFEAHSSLHLSNRILPHSFLTRTLEGKTIFRIPDLLRTVKAPDFELPEIDGDYVVFGIVASKSEPKEVKQNKNISKKEVDPYDDGLNNTNRYMVITLTDLKWTIDLFLFDTAFPRYYKLSEGILIAILNPTIMPPPKNKTDTNRFSLVVSSSDDKILEIGFAQDIGFCKAVRKDGKVCQSWVDGRKTEFCEFHVDVQVRRAQSQRLELNSSPGMFGPGGRSGPRTGFFGGGGKRGGHRGGLKPTGAQYDRASQSVYYISQAPKSGSSFHHVPSGQSAASLIDGDEDPFLAAGVLGRGMDNKEERMRRRLADQQRERDITKKLAASRAGGPGAEYLRARVNDGQSSPNPSQNKTQENVKPMQTPTKPTGLSNFRKADSISLSPMKRGHDGDKPHGSGVKKTRFITAKGIKEAGRDSLGGPAETMLKTNNNDDDDDELDII
ncbi:DNA Replication [Aspergillus sclerotialis]|uniref:DNA Replication n=1 Tax=Aspergillus sclerotialis TaxID=2070753 RepID=A0A3A2ZKI7_9EURO|nr:DNA Replication [Aspergillus sclerotialis]